jgi:hypothetical protein
MMDMHVTRQSLHHGAAARVVRRMPAVPRRVVGLRDVPLDAVLVGGARHGAIAAPVVARHGVATTFVAVVATHVAARVTATGVASLGAFRGALRVALSVALSFARPLPLAARFLTLACATAIAPVTATAALLRKRGTAAQKQQRNERCAGVAEPGVVRVTVFHDASSLW